MSVLKIGKENFEQLVKKSDKPVLLDFSATWCGPCRMVAPILDEIAKEHPELVVGKVDVDEEPELAQAFGVVSIPMLVSMKDGKVLEQMVGARPKEQILALIGK